MSSGVRLVVRLFEIAAALLLAVFTFLVLLQVFARYVLNSPTEWSEEAARLAFVFLTYVGAVVVTYRGRHLRIDFFVNLLPPRTEQLVATITNAGCAAFLLVVLYYSVPLMDKMYNQGGLTTALEWNVATFYAAIPLSALFMLPFVVAQTIESGRRFLQPPRED